MEELGAPNTRRRESEHSGCRHLRRDSDKFIKFVHRLSIFAGSRCSQQKLDRVRDILFLLILRLGIVPLHGLGDCRDHEQHPQNNDGDNKAHLLWVLGKIEELDAHRGLVGSTQESFPSKLSFQMSISASVLLRVIRDLLFVYGMSNRQIRIEIPELEQADVLTAFEMILGLSHSLTCSEKAQNVRRLILRGLSPSEIAVHMRTGEEDIRHQLQTLETPECFDMLDMFVNAERRRNNRMR